MSKFNSGNNPGHRFAAGRSSNPLGRPRSISRLRRDVARELVQHGAALTAMAVQRAIAGDAGCLAACVSLLGTAMVDPEARKQAGYGDAAN